MDEIGGMLGIAQDLLFQYWTLLVAALMFGGVGNFSKKRVWTMDRAINGRPKWLWYWGRASLPMHAPVAGFFFGLMLWFVFGDAAPAGPGVDTVGKLSFYYMGSGIISVWVYNILKQVAKSRGIEVEAIRMPEDQ